MKRYMLALGAIIGGHLVIFACGCDHHEEAVDPIEAVRSMPVSTSAINEQRKLDDGEIWVYNPQTEEEKKVCDLWILDAVQSILPEETRLRLLAEGWALVEDTEAAGMIVAAAGMEPYDVSGGILLARDDNSWSCIKCGYADPPCCTPWPACCSKDKDMYINPMME